MFCRNCGKEMRDDARFCPNCGAVNGTAPGGGAPASPPAWNAAGEGGAKRRGLGLILGAGVAAVAVVALLVVTVSGLFASPKGKVTKAVSKTISAYSDVGKNLGLPDLQKLQKDKSVSAKASVELKGINSQLVGYDLSDLYGLGMALSSNYDGKARKMDFQLSAFWEDDELAVFQMLADGANLYLGSPQFTGDTFLGVNTETLGGDLADLTGEDSVEDISFNLFDLMDLAISAQDTEALEKAIAAANKELEDAVEVKKTGAKTMDINGTSTKTTAYHVVIPQDALEDYADALVDALSALDYMDLYEEMLRSMGLPKSEIDAILYELESVDVYDELTDEVQYILDMLGDVELDVYLSGGYLSAVTYEERIWGSKVKLALYLGGGSQYVDDLSLELNIGDGEIVVESTGSHSGKGGTYTDETTVRVRESGISLGRLTSEMSYESKSGNFHWEVGVDSYGASLGSLEMDGKLTLSKDSLDLKLDEVSARSMGIELFSLGVEYYIGPCKGMEVSVNSSKMLADMDEDDLLDLTYDIRENALDWAYDMQDLFGSRISEELLWQLMYAF